jgi:hypothetical protein
MSKQGEFGDQILPSGAARKVWWVTFHQQQKADAWVDYTTNMVRKIV